ncbi:MAG: hypothetical protein AAF570_14970 [Bacteroidota bacterium]
MPITAILFLFTFFIASSAHAQLNGCAYCNPVITGITQFGDGSNCEIGFGASSNVSGNGLCVRDYHWTVVPDPQNSYISRRSSDGQFANIKFFADGVYTVCVTVTTWFDADGDGVKDANEMCVSDPMCTTVTINGCDGY